MALAPRSRIGQYEILTPLGAGGMGEVYRAWAFDQPEPPTSIWRGKRWLVLKDVGVVPPNIHGPVPCEDRLTMKTAAVALAVIAAALMSATRALEVVSNLDLRRYAGRWYEIARLPNRFQEKCAGNVEATYTMRDDGRITVANRCRERDGTMTEAEGVARRVNGAPPSVLEVRFAPAFLSFLPAVWGDYQVIALDDAHTYSLVGTPDRKYLWILSRTPDLEPATYDRLVETAQEQGFDIGRLVRTAHTGKT